jgi:hypothetical protein
VLRSVEAVIFDPLLRPLLFEALLATNRFDPLAHSFPHPDGRVMMRKLRIDAVTVDPRDDPRTVEHSQVFVLHCDPIEDCNGASLSYRDVLLAVATDEPGRDCSFRRLVPSDKRAYAIAGRKKPRGRVAARPFDPGAVSLPKQKAVSTSKGAGSFMSCATIALSPRITVATTCTYFAGIEPRAASSGVANPGMA